MANEGLYLFNGSQWVRQTTGACTQYVDGGDATIYAYDSNGQPFQIYPTVNADQDASGWGPMAFCTVRSGYSDFRTNAAYQGYYEGNEGHSRENVGNIYWVNGKPVNGRVANISYAQIELARGHGAGNYTATVQGHMWMSPYPDTTNFNEIVNFATSHNSLTFDFYPYNPNGISTTLTDSPTLRNFLKEFFNTTSAKSLCIYTGEGEPPINPRGNRVSENYCSLSYFSMSITYDGIY